MRNPLRHDRSEGRGKSRRRLRDKSRGVALVIALVLLLIVTLLATTGIMVSISELVMAGNEQFHRMATDAASAGVEAAIARLSARPASTSVVTAVDETASGDYIATARYVGEESNVPAFSAEKFAGLHFEIESTGQSARNATDEQLQGVMILVPHSAADTFTQMAGGLANEGSEP